MFVFRIFLFIVLCGCFGGREDLADILSPLDIEENQIEMNSRFNDFKKSLNQKVESLFSKSQPEENLNQKAHQLIRQIEPQVRKIINSFSFLSLLKDDQVESIVQSWSSLIESSLMEKIVQRMEQKVSLSAKDSLSDLSQNVKSLKEDVQKVSNGIRRIGVSSSPSENTEDPIDAAVYEKLKSQYSRGELRVLNDPSFTKPEEEPYQFTSPAGEFLDKNRMVYEKLRQANPYHEQGILARGCGLKFVQTADAFYAGGNEELAQKTHQKAQAMIGIAEGGLPFEAKSIYEVCTGKDLLTGRDIGFWSG